MHLLPMSLKELNLHIDNNHELSRDRMLEIFFSQSHTFVSAQNSDSFPEVVGLQLSQTERIRETVVQGIPKLIVMWHAMALEAVGTFLPSEYPPVSHVIVSYQKHRHLPLPGFPKMNHFWRNSRL
jgi:lauroyl/myristoyl acyltransferase